MLSPRSFSAGRLRISLIVVLILVAAGLLWVLVPRDWEFTGVAERKFTISHPFGRVRQILVRTNAIREVVALNNGQLVDQQWQDLNVDVRQLLTNPDWSLSADGVLKVQIHDPYVGEAVIELNQSVAVTPNQLKVENRLAQPTERLLDYATSTTAAANAEGSAEFQAKVELRVKVRTLYLWRGIARRRVTAAAEQSLAKQEEALRAIVADRQDAAIILPRL
ncbi:MAG: hypothetical protein U0795_13125 [Pirellulales bacterium]